MNYLAQIIFFVILFCSCQNADPDFRPLLVSDGLEDFEILNGEASFARKGNTIIGTTKSNTPNTFLCTRQKFGDFELKFDVLLTEGLNSGVQIRSIADPNIKNGRVHGYQVEIEDSNRGWAAGIYDEARRGWLYPVKHNPDALRNFKKGEWNRYHIIAKGDTLQTWLNGNPVARLVDRMTSEGIIGFQVHSIYDSSQVNQTISWRNIRIKTENVGNITPAGQAPLAEILPPIDTSLQEFVIQDGHHIQLLAAEPQTNAPVEAEIDSDGDIWLVELPGYMRDIDGNNENEPDGKIIVLSDINGDGLVDKRTIFKDSLVAPRALCLAYGGLLYTSGKALYFKNLSNGNISLVDSAYVMGGNIEHQPNGLYYNIDNWIYSAKSNARYRLLNGKWIKDVTTIRGQWGMDADVHGRLVYNNNSNGLRGDMVMPNTVIDNPYLEIKALVRNQLCSDQRVYPYQATALNRGYIPGVLDPEGKLVKFTSVCGPMIYKGEGIWENDAFVCAPEVNAIKQYDLINARDPFSQNYTHTYDNREFLISKDETFRPVNLVGHPKGGFVMVDMRKGIIQHRAYMTHYLRELIKSKGLDKVISRGRIYRITENGHENKSLSYWNRTITDVELIELLGDSNGHMRLAAQKELVARGNPETINLILESLDDLNSWGKVHALWTLDGLNALNKVTLEEVAEASTDNEDYLWYQILNLTDRYSISETAIFTLAAERNNKSINLQLSHTLSDTTNAFQGLRNGLIRRYGDELPFIEAFLSKGIKTASDYSSPLFDEARKTLVSNIETNKKVAPSFITGQFSDNRNEGFPLYNTYCLSCHGTDGLGADGLAPPILHSEYLDGPADKLAALILQGMHGPIKVRGEEYNMNLVMPGSKYNEALGDKEISAIISFVNNAFSLAGRPIKAEQVAKVRKQLEGREEPLTEMEVLGWETKEE